MSSSAGIRIAVTTATHKAPRGFSCVACICDEIAFWHSEGSSPAKEILRAMRPSLARVPGSILIAISTPYSQQGPLWETYREKYGKDDPHVLVAVAPTREMNPTFPESEIDRALKEDCSSARAEYFCEFRAGIESFLDADSIEAAIVDHSKYALPYDKRQKYFAFVDFEKYQSRKNTNGFPKIASCALKQARSASFQRSKILVIEE